MIILTTFLLYFSSNSCHVPFSGWRTRPGTRWRWWRWRTRGARRPWTGVGAAVSSIITPPLHPSTVQWARRTGGKTQGPPPQRLRLLEHAHPAGGAVRRQQHRIGQTRRLGQHPVIAMTWTRVHERKRRLTAQNATVVVIQESLSGIRRRSEGGKWRFFAGRQWARFNNLNGFAGRRLDGFMFYPFDRH